MPKKRNESWESIAKAYLERTCSQEEFCKQRGIKPSTLSYHLTRLKRKTTQPTFLPLEVEKERKGEVILEFPNGLRLTIRG